MQPYVYQTFLYPLLYIFPAYAANAAPVLLGGGKPLDMGAIAFGKRIFGDNKTVRGTAAALLAGFAIGLLEALALGPAYGYMPAVSALMAAGAVSGDLLGSFIKRRIGMRSGSMFPVMDQYGFFVFALLFAYPLGHMPDAYGLAFLTLLTGLVHVLSNVGANKLKLKSVPW